MTTPPSPMSPTAGPEDPSIRLAEVEASTTTDIQAPPDGSIPAEFASAESAGNAWCAEGGTLWHSPQGAMSGGYEIGYQDSDGDADWPTGMSFPHQGP